jgi:ammonia channel protein AmtB
VWKGARPGYAIITPALIIGSFVERIRFRTLVIFVILWSTIVYDPIAHWVWGSGGWLHNLGALDFAGGTVVHISAGFAGLAAAIVIGRRRSYQQGEAIASNNVPFVLLGAALLWFGWFGFNAGSALAASPLAVNAFVVTNTAAAAAALTGNPSQLWTQILAVAVTLTYSFVVTFILLKLLTPLKLRVPEKDEAEGLDIAVHGEEGYRL